MSKRLSAILVAASLALGGALASPQATAADPPRLRDLIVNQSPVLVPEFSPATTAYDATVYRSVRQVDVKPMVDDPTIAVAVNGQAPAANGWVKVPVSVGENSISVTATRAG